MVWLMSKHSMRDPSGRSSAGSAPAAVLLGGLLAEPLCDRNPRVFQRHSQHTALADRLAPI